MIALGDALVFEPLLPVWLIGGALALTVALLALALVRGGRGVAWRALAATLLAAALLDPTLVETERRARPDVALVVVDRSPSQRLPGRAEAAAEAAAGLTAKLAALGVETRVIEAGADGGAGETRLFSALGGSALTEVADRIGAVFLLTDGQIHDVPAGGRPPAGGAPVHALLTGAPGESDVRIVVLDPPAYGLVGAAVDVRWRVERLGPGGGAADAAAPVRLRLDGQPFGEVAAVPGVEQTTTLTLDHAGPTALEIEAAPDPDEVSALNNRAAVVVHGVRDRLRVLLVSGQPHPGERVWRNLLKSDPGVDLVHFTILRPPDKEDATPLKELSLIVFPVQELFEEKLDEFDLVVLDRYAARGILPQPYYGRIAAYVRKGGALLVAAGPEYADSRSLAHTPLAEALPATPTGRIVEQAFTPRVTELGRRHPVTTDLPGEVAEGDASLGVDDAQPSRTPRWGRWHRIVEATADSGHVLMAGPDDRPLLVVDRVGEGRVGMLLSDQAWLWARGIDGGGPQDELLRRLAHWLMKEPALEEESLDAAVADGRLLIRRRSLDEDDHTVRITAPTGETVTMQLEAGADGVARAEAPAPAAGLYRVEDATRVALAASGRADPPEFADLRASAERIAPLVAATGGGVFWLADGLPDVRSVQPGRAAHGDGWLGVRARGAAVVTGVRRTPLAPGLIAAALVIGALFGAWRREGR